MDNKEDVKNIKTNFLDVYDIRNLPNDDAFLKKFELDIKQWNEHDWKNLIAFKNAGSWDSFIHALRHLVAFCNHLENSNETFTIFYKSYNNDNLSELQNDCSEFICENYWEDILEFIEKGYFLIYFSTQRECNDRNQFLMYTLDNWLYNRSVIGQRWNVEDKIKDIEFILLNEK